MDKKNTIKTIIQTLLLMSVLIAGYLITKNRNSFDPFTQKLPTVNGSITLNELKDKKQVVLLYFGFLSCPDICPTTLGKMAAVFKELSDDEKKRVTLLFIDLDPERDSINDIKTYTDFFDPATIPVSLSLKELDLFTRFFGIVFMKMPLKSEMGYTIDHSTHVAVLSPEGKLLEPILHDSPKVVVLDQLRKVLSENK